MKRGSTIGRKRRLNDAQLQRLRDWKPLAQLAREMNISPGTAIWARRYYFKQPSP